MAPLCILILFVIPFVHGRCGPDEQLLAYVNRHCSTQNGDESGSVPVRVGKAGPRGMPGSKGDPGIVDYDGIHRNITDTFEEFSANVDSKLAGVRSITQRSEQCCQQVSQLQAGLEALRGHIISLLKESGWRSASNGFVYKYFNSAKTWQQANADCRRQGAILASTGMRNLNVRSVLLTFVTGNFWVGLTDITHEGRWMWEDGIELSGNDARWYRNEPNNSGGIEDCAYLFQHSGIWEANDSTCNGYAISYLCEKSV